MSHRRPDWPDSNVFQVDIDCWPLGDWRPRERVVVQKSSSDLAFLRRWRQKALFSAIVIAGLAVWGVSARSASAGTAAAADLTWTDASCDGCHETDALFSHPVGIVPSMNVPDPLPLIEGRIACITCHDSRSPADHASARQGHTNLLRTAESDLCSQCHDSTAVTRADMHALMLETAHLRWPGERAITSGSFGDRGTDTADAESAACLGCHDGSVAPSVGNEIGFRLGRRGFGDQSMGGSHPVGTEYGSSGSRKRNTKYNPAALLDNRIRLFEDRVGCGSCHSPFSTEPNLLVMSNYRSKLCMSCHKM